VGAAGCIDRRRRIRLIVLEVGLGAVERLQHTIYGGDPAFKFARGHAAFIGEKVQSLVDAAKRLAKLVRRRVALRDCFLGDDLEARFE